MLTAHPVPGKQKAADLCAAFVAGAPKDAIGHVFYGVKEGNAAAWHKVLRSGEPYYFIDNSYFDVAREIQFRVTRNAVQMPSARVRAAKTNGGRFDNLGVKVEPWLGERPGYWLVVPQSPIFMTLTAENPTWFTDTVVELKRSGREVKVRPWDHNKLKLSATLPADLAGAHALVTHTSAAAITAAMMGVPFRVSPMSAVWTMEPVERYHFFRVLADNQFSTRELRDGTAWKMLHP